MRSLLEQADAANAEGAGRAPAPQDSRQQDSTAEPHDRSTEVEAEMASLTVWKFQEAKLRKALAQEA